MNKLKVVILAAGQGTRMKSKTPKVLHKLLDKTMLDYVIEAAEKSGSKDICIIVGHQSAAVKSMVGRSDILFAYQKEQLGTGHAVMQAGNFITDDDDILILYGDTPLITADTIKKLLKIHKAENNGVTVISAVVQNPSGYGRIIRENQEFSKIVEQKDADEKQKLIREINTGVYVFKGSALNNAFSKLSNNNSQGEYYLTDTIEIIKNSGLRAGIMTADDENEFLGVNSKLQLSQLAKILRSKINENHMLNGVTITDPDNTYIGSDVEIAADTVILPGTILEGKTKIGTDCIIGPNTRMVNSVVKDGVTVQYSVLIESEADNYSSIGPFAYLRPNSKIGEHVRIGDFVEIKNSSIDDGTKVSHLTYVGDSDVGKFINFGCGTVTVNYDGKNKFRTKINDHAFIGCNTNLVAPVEVGENSYIAAGSTITKDVPANALSVAREKQINKPDWVKKLNK